MTPMPGPQVTIDLEKIERNARTVVAKCREAGIGVFGVSKGTCGMPQVARAMLRGGVIGIGESRFENIRRLRDSGIDCQILLLRSPPLSLIEEVVASVDISLNSELAIVQELSRVAERMGRVHDVILMVDLGDLREGIWPSDLVPTAEKIVELPGVRIVGVGTNLTCFGAVLPSEENMSALVEHARSLERLFGLRLTYVSGGNSSSLPLVLAGKMPRGVNNLRIGEAILQGGRDTFYETPWPALETDAFLLAGELLEVKSKPSVPIGRTGVDAFGRRPVFEDKGQRLRGILNVGREDVVVEGLEPVQAGVAVLGASSDHLVLDLSEADPPPRVGDVLKFRMSYGALLAAMTSEYVDKSPMLDKALEKRADRVRLLVDSSLMPVVAEAELPERLGALGLETSVTDLAPGQEPDAVSAQIESALAEHGTAILLGLDHGTSLIGLQAASRCLDAVGLLWFDTRPSLLPPGEPGALGSADTVLYRALGFDQGSPSLAPQLSPENVVLIGLRDVAPSEAETIRGSRLTVFTIEDIDALGIREVMRQALRTAGAGTRGFYVSYCPAVTDIPGTASGSGGITVRETHQAMEAIAHTGALRAMDVVGLRPDQDSRAVAQAFHFLLSAYGKQIL